MLLNILNKSPVWVTLDVKTRRLYIIAFSVIVYVITYALLKYTSNTTYSKYIHYVCMLDLFVLGLLHSYERNDTVKDTPPKMQQISPIDNELNKVYYELNSLDNALNTVAENIADTQLPIYKTENEVDVEFPVYNSTFVQPVPST